MNVLRRRHPTLIRDDGERQILAETTSALRRAWRAARQAEEAYRDHDQNRALDRVVTIGHDLDDALALCSGLEDGIVLDLERLRRRVRDLARDIAFHDERSTSTIGRLTVSLARVHRWTQRAAEMPSAAVSEPGSPSRLAVAINGFASCLLLPAARARHADELLDEIVDLSDHGAGMAAQCACAVRQLLGTGRLNLAARGWQRLH